MLVCLLAPSAQGQASRLRPLTLPTLFRNRVPEAGRAAGREARSVPVSFPFESPSGISFHTVRKSERETVGWSAGRLVGDVSPIRGWRQAAPGAGWVESGAGRGGPSSNRCELGVKIAANSRSTRHHAKRFTRRR